MEEGEARISIAAAMAGTTDYVNTCVPSVEMVMDGFYQSFRTDTTKYFQVVLQNLQKIHEDALDKREQELYRQIGELQGQVLDLQDQLATLTDACKRNENALMVRAEKTVTAVSKKYAKHASPWAMKKIFLAWKARTKRSKQCSKTERLISKWEKQHFHFKMFSLWSRGHSALKFDHSLTEAKFKYDTLSNDVSNDDSPVTYFLHIIIIGFAL